jgi:membrane protein implicated in regulation of membrane protease activity
MQRPISRGALIVFAVFMVVIAFARWMDNRERQERLAQLQARIEALQGQIEKLRHPRN